MVEHKLVNLSVRSLLFWSTLATTGFIITLIVYGHKEFNQYKTISAISTLSKPMTLTFGFAAFAHLYQLNAFLILIWILRTKRNRNDVISFLSCIRNEEKKKQYSERIEEAGDKMCCGKFDSISFHRYQITCLLSYSYCGILVFLGYVPIDMHKQAHDTLVYLLFILSFLAVASQTYRANPYDYTVLAILSVTGLWFFIDRSAVWNQYVYLIVIVLDKYLKVRVQSVKEVTVKYCVIDNEDMVSTGVEKALDKIGEKTNLISDQL